MFPSNVSKLTIASFSLFTFSTNFEARDEDGNLADPSKPSTFIQILRKAQEGHFSRIKVPSAAKQVEIVVEEKKGNTAAIAGGVSGAVS